MVPAHRPQRGVDLDGEEPFEIAVLRRRADDLAEIESVDFADDDGSPEAILIAAEDGERVRRAIAALPQPLREALVLREINGLAYREIAEATETPIGTVMSRLARGRAALAKILEDKR